MHYIASDGMARTASHRRSRLVGLFTADAYECRWPCARSGASGRCWNVRLHAGHATTTSGCATFLKLARDELFRFSSALLLEWHEACSTCTIAPRAAVRCGAIRSIGGFFSVAAVVPRHGTTPICRPRREFCPAYGQIAAYYPSFSTRRWRGCINRGRAYRAASRPGLAALEAEIAEATRTCRSFRPPGARGDPPGAGGETGRPLRTRSSGLPRHSMTRPSAARCRHHSRMASDQRCMWGIRRPDDGKMKFRFKLSGSRAAPLADVGADLEKQGLEGLIEMDFASPTDAAAAVPFGCISFCTTIAGQPGVRDVRQAFESVSSRCGAARRDDGFNRLVIEWMFVCASGLVRALAGIAAEPWTEPVCRRRRWWSRRKCAVDHGLLRALDDGRGIDVGNFRRSTTPAPARTGSGQPDLLAIRARRPQPGPPCDIPTR